MKKIMVTVELPDDNCLNCSYSWISWGAGKRYCRAFDDAELPFVNKKYVRCDACKDAIEFAEKWGAKK